jgi:hypothetical protein
MKEPATIKLQSTHKNQETSLKLSEYLDRQKVAARIRGVMLSSRTAWIAIGQPLFNTTRKKSDTGPKKIRAKRNKACAPASMCSWFITKSVKRIAAMVIVARLNNEMRALAHAESFANPFHVTNEFCIVTHGGGARVGQFDI